MQWTLQTVLRQELLALPVRRNLKLKSFGWDIFLTTREPKKRLFVEDESCTWYAYKLVFSKGHQHFHDTVISNFLLYLAGNNIVSTILSQQSILFLKQFVNRENKAWLLTLEFESWPWSLSLDPGFTNTSVSRKLKRTREMFYKTVFHLKEFHKPKWVHILFIGAFCWFSYSYSLSALLKDSNFFDFLW